MEALKFVDIEALRLFLLSKGVPLEKWGQGEARDIEKLFQELAEGEAVLEEIDGELWRTAYGVCVHVLYQPTDSKLPKQHLFEQKQVYKDNRVRERGHKIGMSIGEKLRPAEKPIVAVHRALREELKINDLTLELTFEKTRDVRKPSTAFPGINTRYASDVYRVILPERHYKPEGYIEVQPDKTTYFVWKDGDPVPLPY